MIAFFAMKSVSFMDARSSLVFRLPPALAAAVSQDGLGFGSRGPPGLRGLGLSPQLVLEPDNLPFRLLQGNIERARRGLLLRMHDEDRRLRRVEDQLRRVLPVLLGGEDDLRAEHV